MLTVILPAYNEEAMIEMAGNVISKILQREEIPFEILFVDDGSKDGTWDAIERAASEKQEIRGVSFSRNFGKEAAVAAGLAEARGECAVVLDCDLQHPPEKIVEMYRLWQQGYEVIEGVKSSRGVESGMHAFAAKTFYGLISAASGFDMENASDFKLLDRKAINAIIGMKEKYAFFRALSSWIGFRTTSVTYDVQERVAGESKWSTRGLIKYAINNITSFSTAPMQIVTVCGVLVFIVSLISGIITLVQKLNGKALGGFTTVILLQGFIGSIIMISLGLIGFYIARIYEELKGRPKYIISRSTNHLSGETDIFRKGPDVNYEHQENRVEASRQGKI
jgi:dolichol-phosphate mannosyltransferase